MRSIQSLTMLLCYTTLSLLPALPGPSSTPPSASCFPKYLSAAIFLSLADSLAPVSPTIRDSMPRSSSRRRWGVSNSLILPPLSTKMRSESMMVFNRWAMVRVVQSTNSLRMVCWMMASVLDRWGTRWGSTGTHWKDHTAASVR